MKFFSFLIVFFAGTVAFAQSPTVPSRMEFAGIKLRIQESGRKDIQESVDALTRSQSHYNAMIEKARSYFPIIDRIFKEENLPTDFKYLVLQESALIPDAVSSSDAVGFWQFKDFTAMEMGLRVDRQIDERMNIVASTRAAAKYLKKNNSFFDNWLHALQAYQMGAGGAMRVLGNESGAKSMTIDKKTYWYVKKFLAHKVAYENVVNAEPQLKLSEYVNGEGKNLKDISKEVDVSEEELEAYNKWLRKGRIPGDKTYAVIIPSEQYVPTTQAPIVVAKNTKTSNEVSTNTGRASIEYKFAQKGTFPKIEEEQDGFVLINDLPGIRAGGNEKVADLAAKGGVSLKRFLKYNDIDIDHSPDRGEIFYLKKKGAKAGTYYHVLQPGESLWEVSQQYGVRLNRLRHKNRIRKDEPRLKAGRVIWLRYVRPSYVDVEYREVKTEPVMVKKDPEPEEKSKPVFKTPQPQPAVESNVPAVDDKEEVIASEENVEDALEETIEEEPAQKKISSVDSVKRIHAVEAGETFYSIAKKYNANVVDVLAWNDMKVSDKLAIGQKLVVYEFGLKEEKDKRPQGAPYVYYTVKAGDTLYKIARNHEITVEELMELNEKRDFNLNLGEKIKVGRKGMAD